MSAPALSLLSIEALNADIEGNGVQSGVVVGGLDSLVQGHLAVCAHVGVQRLDGQQTECGRIDEIDEFPIRNGVGE